MIGGSDAPPPPPPPDPQAEAQAQIELERALAEMRREEEARVAAAEAAREEQRIAEREAAIGEGRAGAEQRIADEFARRGVDAEAYRGDIDSEMARIIAGIPSEAAGTDVGGYFTGDIANPLITRLEDRARAGYNRDLDRFAGTGFARDLYTGTEDDAIIDAIISDQYGTAADVLTRAFDRGTLDQAGLDTGLAKLGEQRTAANSRLQDLGGGLIEGYRTGARDIANTARDRVGTLQLGQEFDPADIERAIMGQRDTSLGRLEGDIRSGLGSESLFDTSGLIQRGAVSQGVTNPVRGNAATGTGGDLLAAMQRRTTEEQRQRGLGTQGVI